MATTQKWGMASLAVSRRTRRGWAGVVSPFGATFAAWNAPGDSTNANTSTKPDRAPHPRPRAGLPRHPSEAPWRMREGVAILRVDLGHLGRDQEFQSGLTRIRANRRNFAGN